MHRCHTRLCRLTLELTVGVVFSTLVMNADSVSRVTVTSNPLWTNTGVVLTPGDIVTVSDAGGSWNTSLGFSGPEGIATTQYLYDEWVKDGHHGELIGYVSDLAQSPYDPNATGFFAIGISS